MLRDTKRTGSQGPVLSRSLPDSSLRLYQSISRFGFVERCRPMWRRQSRLVRELRSGPSPACRRRWLRHEVSKSDEGSSSLIFSNNMASMRLCLAIANRLSEAALPASRPVRCATCFASVLTPGSPHPTSLRSATFSPEREKELRQHSRTSGSFVQLSVTPNTRWKREDADMIVCATLFQRPFRIH